MTIVDSEGVRISKSEFLGRVALRSGEPLYVVRGVYEAIFGELTAAVRRGEMVVLRSFGRFYRQDHKGHKVRFRKEDVDDYSVLKFSASRTVNSMLDRAVSADAAEQAQAKYFTTEGEADDTFIDDYAGEQARVQPKAVHRALDAVLS